MPKRQSSKRDENKGEGKWISRKDAKGAKEREQ